MEKRKSQWLFWVILGSASFVLAVTTTVAVLLYVLHDDTDSDFSFSSHKIGVVELTGVIFDSKSWIEQLQRFGENSSIKAIVLRIDSPGGGVAASQEVYNEVLRIRREKRKIIVSSIGSVGASGAYYIACGTDKIVANPASITGSIGVIAEWVNYGELLKWAKLKSVVLKSSELKDAGSPVRELTEEEKKYLQNIIDDMYIQFVQVVAEGRKFDLERAKSFSDGRVYTGKDAKAKKLIDEIGSLQDAIQITAKLAKISGEPRLVYPARERTGLIDLFFGDATRVLPLGAALPDQRIQFSYLWK
ncbi:MAG: signal peptide peptidase SppA [Acidobacteria bacterium]|nr:signal peptide peptidase SppA [Acidobacteriota bacterium]MCI0724207.1 signal peptide peptidase SppA [Acidobacteriota bacterium]